MGLDGVELVMEVEEVFNISLTDEEAVATVTVGDLYHLVRRKLQTVEGCPTAAAFYQIRRAMVSALGIARHRVRPTTRLDELLPRSDRRAAWQQLRQATGLRLPELRHPVFVTRLTRILGGLMLIGPPLVYTVLNWGRIDPIVWPFVVLAITIASLLPFALMMSLVSTLTRAFRVQFNPEWDTMAGLVRAAVPRDPGVLPTDQQPDPSDPTWQSLVCIVSGILGVKPDRVTPESQFVRDLGCG